MNSIEIIYWVIAFVSIVIAFLLDYIRYKRTKAKCSFEKFYLEVELPIDFINLFIGVFWPISLPIKIVCCLFFNTFKDNDTRNIY